MKDNKYLMLDNMEKYFDLARKITFSDLTNEEIQEFFDNGKLKIKDNKIYCDMTTQDVSIDIDTMEIKKELVDEDEFIKRIVKEYDELTTSDLQGIVETYIILSNNDKDLDIRTEFELSDKLLKKIYEKIEE